PAARFARSARARPPRVPPLRGAHGSACRAGEVPQGARDPDRDPLSGSDASSAAGRAPRAAAASAHRAPRRRDPDLADVGRPHGRGDRPGRRRGAGLLPSLMVLRAAGRRGARGPAGRGEPMMILPAAGRRGAAAPSGDTSPLRILQLYPKADYFTGAAIQLRDLAIGLAARGHTVTVATPPSEIWAERMRAAGIGYAPIPMRRAW